MVFFEFWVNELWGSALLTFFGTAFIFTIIGVMGKMSIPLLTTMLLIYFLVFGTGFWGMAYWLPIFIFSLCYFVFQLYKFIQKSD